MLAFYRGTSKGEPSEAPYIGTTRKDRKPRNIANAIHLRADDWFENRFGVKYRSQALFLSSSRFTAQHYAASEKHVVRIIPLGTYKYCWSPNVRDLLSRFKEPSAVDHVNDILGAAGYIESDLLGAHKSEHEVMLYCEKYIAIPLHLLEEATPTKEQKSLIYLGGN